jgi:Ran GTPase-activating protein (RanGAP) involved in mRNA processing and transport
MKDSQLASILEAVLAQKCLKELVYIKGEMGKESVEKIKQIFDCYNSGIFLRVLRLFDVTGLGAREKLMLMEEIASSKTLTKIELSGINLNKPEVVESVSDLIERSLTLNHLDLSWSSLRTANLVLVLESLAATPTAIRHLDLSYNSLNHSGDTFLAEQYEKFTKALSDFLKKAKVLSHVLLSGMEIAAEDILDISEILADSSTLMSIHLSDLGIIDELASSVLEIFQIENSHLQQRPAVD